MTAWMTLVLGIAAIMIHTSDADPNDIQITGTTYIPALDRYLDALARDNPLLFFAMCAYLGVAFISALMIGTTWFNASHWKGGLRFRYDKSNEELFFPRENALYYRSDYNEFVLGTTDGYCTTAILEQHEENKTRVKQDRREPTRITETYFLVHLKDGTWARHLIAYDDSTKKHIQPTLVKLQETLQCERTTRKMTVAECFASQSHITGHASQPKAGPSPVNYVVLGVTCAIFGLGGLGFIGIGLYEVIYVGRASGYFGFIGIVPFLLSLGGALFLRHLAKEGHPHAW